MDLMKENVGPRAGFILKSPPPDADYLNESAMQRVLAMSIVIDYRLLVVFEPMPVSS